MLIQKPVSVLVLSVVFTMLCLLSSVVTAQTDTSATRNSTNFSQATDNALAAARKELIDAAKAHGVRIEIERMLCAGDGKTMIVHAPIAGLEKYGTADFAKGAPILLVIVKSSLRLAVPNGSYVVKAEYQPGASTGKATFTNSNGSVSIERELIVRSWEQSGVLFPSVYTRPPPVNIPNITSIEVFVDVLGHYHYYYDCSGVNGTLYFAMG